MNSWLEERSVNGHLFGNDTVVCTGITCAPKAPFRDPKTQCFLGKDWTNALLLPLE